MRREKDGPDPLEVDGARVGVRLVAEIPAGWTTDGERLILFALACDAYVIDSAPGLDNLAAWTGMQRRSVVRILERLQQTTDDRPPLLLKTKKSRGGPKVTSSYRLLLTAQETTSNSDLTGTQQGPKDTDNSDLTVAKTGTVGHPPFPSPKEPSPSLTPAAKAVAVALKLKDDDEILQSVPQMLKDHRVDNPSAWITSVARAGDLHRLLEDAHAPVRAKALQEAQWAAEADASRCPHGVINGVNAWKCEVCFTAAGSPETPKRADTPEIVKCAKCDRVLGWMDALYWHKTLCSDCEVAVDAP